MPNESYPNIFRAAEHGTVDDVKHFIEHKGRAGRMPLDVADTEEKKQILREAGA